MNTDYFAAGPQLALKNIANAIDFLRMNYCWQREAASLGFRLFEEMQNADFNLIRGESKTNEEKWREAQRSNLFEIIVFLEQMVDEHHGFQIKMLSGYAEMLMNNLQTDAEINPSNRTSREVYNQNSRLVIDRRVLEKKSIRTTRRREQHKRGQIGQSTNEVAGEFRVDETEKRSEQAGQSRDEEIRLDSAKESSESSKA